MRQGGAVVAALGAAAAVAIGVVAPEGAVGDSPTPITTCDTATVQAAITAGGDYTFQCGGTILTPVSTSNPAEHVPFVVPSGDTVTLDATNAPSTVTLQGTESQVFEVDGGDLTLNSVTVQHGLALGTAGTPGTSGTTGAAGSNGAAGKAGSAPGGPSAGMSGKPGKQGGNGTKAGAGTDGLGGAIYQLGGEVTLDDDIFQSDNAEGGAGGAGGTGGNGGLGGSGGLGGAGYYDPSSGAQSGGEGGGNGADGGPGGNGANGGAGGNGMGGAIYSTGTLTIQDSLFTADGAMGGNGGVAGAGGFGGSGGAGGTGGSGAQNPTGRGSDGAEAGVAGNGMDTGDGGANGAGGRAGGGAIYATGSLTLISDNFGDDGAAGGDGGFVTGGREGGTGGNGGNGGAGGSPCGTGGGATGSGSGGNGGTQQPGGRGGSATGGAVATVAGASTTGVQYGAAGGQDAVTAGLGGQGNGAYFGAPHGNPGDRGGPGGSSETLECTGAPGAPAGTGGTAGTNGAATPAGTSGTATNKDYDGSTPAPEGPVNVTPPSISGPTQPVQGDTLTAVPGTWDPETTGSELSYQWEDCDSSGAECAAIAGATATSYTLTFADAGSTIVVLETATGSNGGVSAPGASEATAVVLPLPPAIVMLPSTSGPLLSGQTLTLTQGTWSNDPTTVSDVWEDCDATGAGCEPIAGATGLSYLLAASDVGHTIRVSETASNAGGPAASPAVSDPTAVVQEPVPPPSATKPSPGGEPPVISGSAIVDTTLTSSTGAWSGNPAPTFAYQWQKCGSSCDPIGGATGSSYKIAPGDAGARLRVVVTATNSAGSASATSAETSTVKAAGPSAASIKSLLESILAPSGSAAKIASIRKHGGYSFTFKAPVAGRLQISWRPPLKIAHDAGKKLSLPPVIAGLSVVFHKAGGAKVKALLSAQGRKDLKKATALKLDATGTFTPTGQSAVTASKSFTLKK
jgi:hypothetical protein